MDEGLAALKAKIEKFIGFELTPVFKTSRVELHLISETGVVIGAVDCYTDEGGRWRWGGLSGFLPNAWDEMFKLNNP